jgi:hypothetical protein
LTIAKNSVANLARLGVSVLVALVLPPFLTRRLSHDMYAAGKQNPRSSTSNFREEP